MSVRPIGGANFTCALSSDGANNIVRCWDGNSKGQLGDGSVIGRPTASSFNVLEGANVIAASHMHVCALMNDSSMRCWGYNAYGQPGDGSTTDRLSPVLVANGLCP